MFLIVSKQTLSTNIHPIDGGENEPLETPYAESPPNIECSVGTLYKTQQETRDTATPLRNPLVPRGFHIALRVCWFCRTLAEYDSIANVYHPRDLTIELPAHSEKFDAAFH